MDDSGLEISQPAPEAAVRADTYEVNHLFEEHVIACFLIPAFTDRSSKVTSQERRPFYVIPRKSTWGPRYA